MTMRSDVAKAITEEIRRQNVDPFSNSRYTSIAPPIDWDKVANAATKAAGVEDLERKIALVMAHDSNLINYLERHVPKTTFEQMGF